MTQKTIRPAVVLIKEGKILLLRSKYSSGEFYLLPGGGIEGTESLEETAVREVKEETNYDIKIEKLLYLQEWIEKDRGKNVLSVIFLGKIISGKETHLLDPCLASGHIKGIEWVEINKLHEIEFHPKEIVHLLQKDYKNGFKSSGIYIKPNSK